MKASSRLPVLMYGPENIISSAQSLIVDDSPDYLCYNVDKGRTVDILRHCINTGKHCMMKEGPRKIEDSSVPSDFALLMVRSFLMKYPMMKF